MENINFGLDKCPSHSGSLTKDVVPLFMPKTECNFHARKYLGLTIAFKSFVRPICEYSISGFSLQFQFYWPVL